MSTLHSLFARAVLLATLSFTTACKQSDPTSNTSTPAQPAPSSSASPHGSLPPGHPNVPNYAFDSADAQALPPSHPPIQPVAETNDIVWDDPPGWTREVPRSAMRKAQYSVRRDGSTTPIEVTVFMFGAGNGGDVESNIQRWIGQVQLPNGADPNTVARRENFTVGTFSVHTVEVAGTIASSMGSAGAAPMAQARLLAAVVETPSGNWFFKMVGNDADVSAARDAFTTMMRSLRPAGAPSNGTSTDAGSHNG